MTLNMDKMEYLNSVFKEKLMTVAAEIFEAVKNTVCEYQGEVERMKQENQCLRNQLSEMRDRIDRHTEDGRSCQAVSQVQPNINHEVKVVLSTMKQDLQPDIPSDFVAVPVNDPEPLSTMKQDFQPELPCEYTFEDRKIKSETWNCPFIAVHLSSMVNNERVPENYVVGLGDDQGPGLSSQCQSQSVETVSLSEYCKKPFRNRMQRKKPSFVHQKERPRPFRCDWCGKFYTSSQVLEVHRRTHTGERPYRCRVCGRRFKQQNHLNDHERIHTGEKPFSCPVCGKRFIQSGHVRKHMNCHLPPKS